MKQQAKWFYKMEQHAFFSAFMKKACTRLFSYTIDTFVMFWKRELSSKGKLVQQVSTLLCVKTQSAEDGDPGKQCERMGVLKRLII